MARIPCHSINIPGLAHPAIPADANVRAPESGCSKNSVL